MAHLLVKLIVTNLKTTLSTHTSSGFGRWSTSLKTDNMVMKEEEVDVPQKA